MECQSEFAVIVGNGRNKTYLGITKNHDDNSKVDMSHQIYPLAGDTYRRCAGVVTSGVSNALGGKADNVISLSNDKLELELKKQAISYSFQTAINCAA